VTLSGCASLLRKLDETCALNPAQGMRRQLCRNTWTTSEQSEHCMLLVPPAANDDEPAARAPGRQSCQDHVSDGTESQSLLQLPDVNRCARSERRRAGRKARNNGKAAWVHPHLRL